MSAIHGSQKELRQAREFGVFAFGVGFEVVRFGWSASRFLGGAVFLWFAKGFLPCLAQDPLVLFLGRTRGLITDGVELRQFGRHNGTHNKTLCMLLNG